MSSERAFLDSGLHISKAKPKSNESANRNRKTVIRIDKREWTSVSCCDYDASTAHRLLSHATPSFSACGKYDSACLEYDEK